MEYINCPDLADNKFVSLFTSINGITFRLTFKWNEYCNCCFMSIYDSDGGPVNTGIGLTTKSIIHNDKRVLPDIYFRHKEDLNLEPTAKTLKDYILLYEDTAE